MARLIVTMETMHAVGRRNLPPVPRAAVETITPAAVEVEVPVAAQQAAPDAVETAAATEPDAEIEAAVIPDAGADEAVPVAVDATARIDAGQAFVARLRAAAPAFAEAAGAVSAVVREAVPPARHRRSCCRVVFRYADGSEADLTFVGERRRPGASAEESLDAEITRWLSDGQLRDPAWLVPDPEAPDGTAVDVTAWLATG
ncbi:hypothetical protein [Blastococcus montanus]|uniref:hypothetical protein n=1 Tax=Blastococcus montanus TaxID=3144973 RepID=UPI00320824F6